MITAVSSVARQLSACVFACNAEVVSCWEWEQVSHRLWRQLFILCQKVRGAAAVAHIWCLYGYNKAREAMHCSRCVAWHLVVFKRLPK